MLRMMALVVKTMMRVMMQIAVLLLFLGMIAERRLYLVFRIVPRSSPLIES